MQPLQYLATILNRISALAANTDYEPVSNNASFVSMAIRGFRSFFPHNRQVPGKIQIGERNPNVHLVSVDQVVVLSAPLQGKLGTNQSTPALLFDPGILSTGMGS